MIRTKEQRKKLSLAQKRAWANGSYDNRNYDNIRKACIKMGKKYGKINGGWNKKSHSNQICPNCNSTFFLYKKKQLCCSRKCAKEFYIGKNHWCYLDIRKSKLRTGIGWQKIRKNIIKHYNGTCQNCNEKGNVVHHILPRRFFYNIDDSNKRENLILLCERCHRIIDAKLRWYRKEGEVRESLRRLIAMVTLNQVLAEMLRKVQRLMAKAKSK